jgi:eukaryotic-like serine/threonine-protein kinase
MSRVCPSCALSYDDTTVFCPVDGAVLRADPAQSSLIGTVLDERYLITSQIGEGGMGTVYRGRHVKLPRDAAIKIMHGNLTADPAALARFHREAAAASRVEHDAVARVYDFGETAQGLVYLALEYLDGPTLKAELAQHGPLPLARTAALVQQIAAGLDAAHRQGIVHRDLKADNVLVVRTEAGAEQAKIVDFGIAKAIGAGERSLTRTGFVVGTPEYMSPEQLLGETVDHRSDVYALALLAYHLLTGDMPFDTRTPDRGLMARLTSDPRPLELVRPDTRWPEAVQAVLNRGMHRDRAQRTPSAIEFARDFAAASHGKPGRMKRTPAVPVPPVLPVSRSRTTPAGGAAARAVAAPSSPPPPAATPQPATPVRPQVTVGRGRRRRWRLPQLPIVRWTLTAALLWFGYLLLTEGSLNRAVRKVRALAQQVERQLR